MRWFAKPEIRGLASQVGMCGGGHEGGVCARFEEYVEQVWKVSRWEAVCHQT